MDQQKRRKEGNEEKCTKVVVILSKKEQKILYLEQFKENLESVKKLFPDIPNATDPMSVLLELIEAVQDPEYLKNHFQEIREIIPLYMSFDRNDLSEPAQVLDDYFAVRHAALKNDACELNEFLTMQLILPVLSRSDEKMDISQEANKFVDRDGILDKIGKEINKKYSSFCNECTEIMQKSKPMPTVRMVLKKTIFSSPRVFPILPALFSLNAVNQVLGGRKEAKTKLLMPDSSLPQLDRQANELSSIGKQEQQLVRNIQKMLLKEMDDFYQPMLVYKPLNQSQSMQAALRSSANLGWRETKPSFKKLTCKPYGILFCRTDRLAIDLALYCKLSSEKMLHLREQLSQYVMSYKDNQKVLKNEYGDQAAEIIKVFAELIKQDVYACGKSWDENLFEILKRNTKTSQSFFPVKYIDEKQENIDNAYHFFKNIFITFLFIKE